MRTRTLILSLFAALALSAVAAGAAQAKPVWFVHGAELKAGEKAGILSENASNQEDGFIQKQLTVPAAGLAIICGRESSNAGELVGGNPGTVKKLTVVFTKCEVFSTKGEEETKKPSRPPFKFTEKLGACGVKGTGNAAGEIATKELEGTLAYKPGTAKAIIVTAFKPEVGSFVTIEITGASCAVKATANVEGSVIGMVETPYEEPVGTVLEKLVNPLEFTYKTEIVSGKLNKCTQEPTEYETESGAKVADTLEFGGHPACFYDEDWVTLAAGGRFGVK